MLRKNESHEAPRSTQKV